MNWHRDLEEGICAECRLQKAQAEIEALRASMEDKNETKDEAEEGLEQWAEIQKELRSSSSG